MLILVIACCKSDRSEVPVSVPFSGAVEERGVTWRSAGGFPASVEESPLVWGSSSQSSNSPGSSTSASRSATALQFGQRKLGHVGPFRMGRMHL
jgi:hypothetical protein